MLANPQILLYLTERNAWEIRHFSGMQHNLPPFHVFFISVEPANSTGKILHRLHSLEGKSRPNCLQLVGLGIQPQNGQRDNFTHEQPCFHTYSFGVPITVKSSLTPGFFQKFASTHHSSFMMPAWGLLQWEMALETLINRKLTRFEPNCPAYRASNCRMLTSQ